MRVRIELVVPCFDEERRLHPDEFRRALDERPSLTLLLVDDGSRDRTRTLLEEIVAACPERARLLVLAENRGKQEAVRRGLLDALERDADVVGYWDADLSTPFAALDELLPALHDPAVLSVWGSRKKLGGARIDRRLHRHLAGRLFATAVRLMHGIPIHDTQCGAKLFRAGDWLRPILTEPFQAGWAFDVELYLRMRAEDGIDPDREVLELPLGTWTHVPEGKVSALDLPRSLLALWRLR